MSGLPYPEIRRLIPGDEAMIDAFLVPYTASSMFLRSNMRKAGLSFEGKQLQGVYLGSFDGDALQGVIAHYYNGNVVVQAPAGVPGLACALIGESPLPLKGLIGPWHQAEECLHVWGLARADMQVSHHEFLFYLKLEDMRVPQALRDGLLTVRRCKPDDFPPLLEWHVAYDIEALNAVDSEEVRAENVENLNRSYANGHQFILESNGVLMAMCTFNSEVDDTVQLGGVYTPPELRGRGYGRAVVAGALQIAVQEGARKAVLFTDDKNIAAQKPYRAIGFQQIGEYAINLFGKDARELLPRNI